MLLGGLPAAIEHITFALFLFRVLEVLGALGLVARVVNRVYEGRLAYGQGALMLVLDADLVLTVAVYFGGEVKLVGGRVPRCRGMTGGGVHHAGEEQVAVRGSLEGVGIQDDEGTFQLESLLRVGNTRILLRKG